VSDSISYVAAADNLGTEQSKVQIGCFHQQIEQDLGRQQIMHQFKNEDPELVNEFVTMPRSEAYRVWRGYPPQPQQYQPQQRQEQHHQQHQHSQVFRQPSSAALLHQGFSPQEMASMQAADPNYGGFPVNAPGDTMQFSADYSYYQAPSGNNGGWP
jgi:hypothetical protein